VFLFSYQCSAASLSGLLAYSTTLLRPLQGFFSKKWRKFLWCDIWGLYGCELPPT